MPTYEYRCPNGHTFELFQRMSDPPPEECQICAEAPLVKVLYPIAIHFKGSGFYSTDYGRGGRKRDDPGKDGDSSSSESSSSDGKPDEKKKPDKPEKKATEA
jgi:putative FmdB family regulatory protein